MQVGYHNKDCRIPAQNAQDPVVLSCIFAPGILYIQKKECNDVCTKFSVEMC